MERHGLDVLLVTAPEDIHYLCGLDHQGHFAVTGLVVPLGGEPVLVERAMEAADASRTAMSVLRTALRPGSTAEQVFGAWHSAIESALGGPYERHHCGYLVGIRFPPGWMGGSRAITLLRPTSGLSEEHTRALCRDLERLSRSRAIRTFAAAWGRCRCSSTKTIPAPPLRLDGTDKRPDLIVRNLYV